MADIKALPPHDKSDTPIYHTVVRLLGLSMVLAVGGAIYLAIIGKPVPEVVVVIGSTSAGALVGILAPTPSGK